MKQLWIIILNWNRPDLTIECLDSLQILNSRTFKTNILIVDNGSTDDSIKKINFHIGRKLKFSKNKKASLIETGINKGYAGGNNYGLRYALERGADYLMLLNNDTNVDKDFASELIKTHIEKAAGVVCPKIYFAPGFEFKNYNKSDLGNVIWSVGGEFDWNNVYGTNRGVDQVDEGQFEKTEEVDFASGACFLVSREVINKVGLLDENYFMYLEDVDFCHRVKLADFNLVYVPKSEIWHKVAQSSKIGSNLNDYFITRNRLLFGYRYASTKTKLALLRESIRFCINGRKWQRIGVRDYYKKNLGKGSWKHDE
ncbi:glycosyltransferase family 2 protein [Patescibacteria group bacterium]